jgi:hypothetical protein
MLQITINHSTSEMAASNALGRDENPELDFMTIRE